MIRCLEIAKTAVPYLLPGVAEEGLRRTKANAEKHNTFRGLLIARNLVYAGVALAALGAIALAFGSPVVGWISLGIGLVGIAFGVKSLYIFASYVYYEKQLPAYPA